MFSYPIFHLIFYAFLNLGASDEMVKLPAEEAPLVYCTPSGATPWNDYITGVTLGSIQNTSQNPSKSTPLADYTSLSATLTQGASYAFTINTQVANWSMPQTTHIKIWIDFNGDDDFDDTGEEVYSDSQNLTAGDNPYNYSGNISVPSNATLGTTRMRVGIRQGQAPAPCGDAGGFFGEMEDYGIVISSINGLPEITYTSQGESSAGAADGVIDVSVTGGTIPYTYAWSNGATSQDIFGLAAGSYTVTVTDFSGSQDIETIIISTTGGGSGSYCSAEGREPWNEWIDYVSFGTIAYQQIVNDPSGTDEAKSLYSDFTATQQTDIEAEGTYTLTIRGKVNWMVVDEYFKAWIDYNGDGDFEDVGEEILSDFSSVSTAGAAQNAEVTATINIPANVSIGLTRMRIAMKRGAYANSCGSYVAGEFGEVEDYSINLVPNPISPVVWEDIPANVSIQSLFQPNYIKAYNDQSEYLKGCGTLAPNTDGTLFFELHQDPFFTKDWVYVGLVEKGKTISNSGTQDADFLIAVRGFDRQIILSELGTQVYTQTLTWQLGKQFKIERTGGILKYYYGDDLLYQYTGNASSLELQPILYLNEGGFDKQVRLSIDQSANFSCPALYVRPILSMATTKSGGQIRLNIEGGQLPYTINWSDTNLSGDFIQNLKAGTYSVTVTDANNTSISKSFEIYKVRAVEWSSIPGGVVVDEDNYFNNLPGSTVLTGCQGINLITGAKGIIEFDLRKTIDDQNNLNEFNILVGVPGRSVLNANEDAQIGLKINNFGVTFIEGLTQHTTPTYPNDARRSFSGYQYALEFLNNDVIAYKNGKEIYRYPLPSNFLVPVQLELHLLNTSSDNGIKVPIKTSFSCVPPAPSVAIYHPVKRQLDGGYIEVRDDKLRVQLNEFYYIEPGYYDEDTQYQILDGANNVKQADMFFSSDNGKGRFYDNEVASYTKGVNWYTLDISPSKIQGGNLIDGAYYTLVVSGGNKGETAYLRFRYYTPAQ